MRDGRSPARRPPTVRAALAVTDGAPGLGNGTDQSARPRVLALGSPHGRPAEAGGTAEAASEHAGRHRSSPLWLCRTSFLPFRAPWRLKLGTCPAASLAALGNVGAPWGAVGS